MRELGYEETIVVVRRLYGDACANLRAFGIRSRGHPERLSVRQWAELAEIESIAAQLLADALARQLHVAAASAWGDAGATLRGLWNGLVPERRLLASILRRARDQPVAAWRAGAPQLEAQLWPFICDRSEHLANAVALALDEPAPYPPLIWSPRARAFQR